MATTVVMEDILKIPAISDMAILVDIQYITEEKENKDHLLPIRLLKDIHRQLATIKMETAYLCSRKQTIPIKLIFRIPIKLLV